MTKPIQLIYRNKKIFYLFLSLLGIIYCLNLLNSKQNLVIAKAKNEIGNILLDNSYTELTRLNFIQIQEIFNFLYINDVFLLDIDILSSIRFKNSQDTADLNLDRIHPVDSFEKIRPYFRHKKNILICFGALIGSYSRITQVN